MCCRWALARANRRRALHFPLRAALNAGDGYRGARFIGSHLVDVLLARGDEVHAVDNFLGWRAKQTLAGGPRLDLEHSGRLVLGGDRVAAARTTEQVMQDPSDEPDPAEQQVRERRDEEPQDHERDGRR